ncbi:hypothetical protein JXA63_00300 [Candidatus Woesebacteria bacterium]|nr:hypothetical protein [Candidatus Woesebacteria bacterium]
MKSVQENDNIKFISLKKAAEVLNVSIETLLEWNELNIFKPTITQSGEIGYTDQQLTRFIELRKTLQNAPSTQGKVQHRNSATYIPEEQITPLGSNIQQKHTPAPETQGSAKTIKPSSIKLLSISFVSFLLVIGISLIFSLPTKQTQVSHEGDNLVVDLTSKNTSDAPAKEMQIIDSSVKKVDLVSREGSQKTTTDELSLISQELEENSLNYKIRSGDSVDIYYDAFSLIDRPEDRNFSDDESPALNHIDSKLLPISSSRPNPDINGSIQNGNPISDDGIKLALNFDYLTLNSQSLNKKYDWLVLMVTTSLGLFLVVHHFNSVLAIEPTKDTTNKTVRIDPVHKSLIDKVFEVHQKTDGTVVISHNNNEYKVSKPELNSETDQLIQRLLSYIGTGKEINYDIIKDEKLNLNTPLSKVVTRLGFVGTKRDLFFPRTSKNKVIFRKYVTKNDLAIMSLSEENILQNIHSSN